MTQEELDAFMKSDINIDELSDEQLLQEDSTVLKDKIKSAKLPLPATNENKIVHQLDDVIKESEEKASKIFDSIEIISNDLMEKEKLLTTVLTAFNANIELFEKLTTKFPDIETFKKQLELNKQAVEDTNSTIETLQNSGDSIVTVMDIMQYQDIHRQKIERVINVMRTLSKYMNTLFESKIDDEKRVSSATHIAGDTHNDVVLREDIEALLAQLGK